MNGYLDEYDALIIEDFDLAYVWISVIYTVRFLFIAIGNHIAPIIEKKIKAKNTIFTLALIASLFLLAFSIVWNQWAIAVLGLYCMIMAVAEVIQINIIQSAISEEGRATVMSMYSVGQNIVMIIFSLIYALLSGIFSLKIVYIILSIYCIIGTILLYFIKISIKQTAKKEQKYE